MMDGLWKETGASVYEEWINGWMDMDGYGEGEAAKERQIEAIQQEGVGKKE